MTRDGDDWDDDWRHIICCHGPHGAMTWHVSDADFTEFFSHLPAEIEGIPPHEWDSHSTNEKYKRLLSCMPGDFATIVATLPNGAICRLFTPMKLVTISIGEFDKTFGPPVGGDTLAS